MFYCGCPLRLVSGTDSLMIDRLVNMFDDIGCGRSWNMALWIGNPASSIQVKYNLIIVQEKQARGHLVPKQTNPIF